MFQFLGSIASALRPVGDIAGILGAGAGIANLFGVGRDRGTERAMRAQAQRAAELSEALANPSSPLFQQMAGEQLQQQRTAELTALRDLANAQMRQARRFPQMAGTGAMFAGGPRQDEMLMRRLAQSSQNEQARANALARQQISSALSGVAPATQALGGEVERQRMQRGQMISGLLAVPRLLRGIEQEYGGQTVSPVAGTINQPRQPQFTVGGAYQQPFGYQR